MNRICLSLFLQERDLPSLLEKIKAKKPDLIEFRLDYLKVHSVLDTVAEDKACPIIATDRSDRNQVESRNLLLHAAEAGFDFVDVNLSHPLIGSIVDELRTKGVEVIVSHHDFVRTPPKNTLLELLQAEKKMGGQVCKIVTTATTPADNLTVLGFINECSQSARVIAFAMGTLGIPSRVLSPFFGSEFTFAALDDKSLTAEGQLSIDRLRRTWKMLEVS